MVGRPKGSKNHAGHHAGGARPGAGRRKKETNEPTAGVSDTARANQLLNRLLPGHGSRLAKVSIALEDGRIIHVTAPELAERDTQRKLAVKQRAESSAPPPPPPLDLLDPAHNNGIIMLPLDPELQHSRYEGISTQGPSSVSENMITALAPYLQAPGMDLPPGSADLVNQFSNIDSLTFGSLDAPVIATASSVSTPGLDPTLPRSQSSLVLPLPVITYAPGTAHRMIVDALGTGMGAPARLAGSKPVTVEGPYAFGPRQDAPVASTSSAPETATNPGLALVGPLEPDLLRVEEPIAVYFVLYERMVPARPVLKHANESGTPADAEGETEGKRAPRSCVICQSFSCKGRGGRHLCPSYQADNNAHQVPPNRRYKKPVPSTSARSNASSTADDISTLQPPDGAAALQQADTVVPPSNLGYTAPSFDDASMENFFMYHHDDPGPAAASHEQLGLPPAKRTRLAPAP